MNTLLIAQIREHLVKARIEICIAWSLANDASVNSDEFSFEDAIEHALTEITNQIAHCDIEIERGIN